jgi:hypothetical protein
MHGPSERNGFEHAGEDVNPTSGRPFLNGVTSITAVMDRNL